MDAHGFLAGLKATNRVLEVPMGSVQHVHFQQLEAIGTADLGACSVVVIASSTAAILAHIPPQPVYSPATDPHAGDDNVRSMMGQVSALYQQQRAYFPTAATVVVCAWFQGEMALPDQVTIMKQSLEQMGLVPIIRIYHVPNDRSRRGQGTVVVFRNASQGRTQVFVEDELVWG